MFRRRSTRPRLSAISSQRLPVMCCSPTLQCLPDAVGNARWQLCIRLSVWVAGVLGGVKMPDVPFAAVGGVSVVVGLSECHLNSVMFMVSSFWVGRRALDRQPTKAEVCISCRRSRCYQDRIPSRQMFALPSGALALHWDDLPGKSQDKHEALGGTAAHWLELGCVGQISTFPSHTSIPQGAIATLSSNNLSSSSNSQELSAI